MKKLPNKETNEILIDKIFKHTLLVVQNFEFLKSLHAIKRPHNHQTYSLSNVNEIYEDYDHFFLFVKEALFCKVINDLHALYDTSIRDKKKLSFQYFANILPKSEFTNKLESIRNSNTYYLTVVLTDIRHNVTAHLAKKNVLDTLPIADTEILIEQTKELMDLLRLHTNADPSFDWTTHANDISSSIKRLLRHITDGREVFVYREIAEERQDLDYRRN